MQPAGQRPGLRVVAGAEGGPGPSGVKASGPGARGPGGQNDAPGSAPGGPAGVDGPVSVERLPGPTARPPTRAWRFFHAYWTTFVVIASYLSVKFQARYRSSESIQRILMEKHRRNARRIERTIISLQGLFIKVGQLISIMTNFLPAEFREGLEGLQDQVPPRPFPDIEKRIREEFGGQSIGELFAEFDQRPVAAASIGQVHAARLPTGERVAVKVQYPDIDEIVRIDLRTLRRIFSIVSWFVPHHGLDGVYREIKAMITAELDFRLEAQNGRRIAENFEGRDDVSFPLVIDRLTTGRVLTTRWEDGVKISDTQRLAALGVDRKVLARKVIEAYCQQIFVDGVYHADPHPGNVLARRCDDHPAEGNACIVFLDFGAVAEVSPKMRAGIIDFLQGAIHRDTQRIVRAMKDMGFVARGADERTFDRVIEYFHQRFQEEIQLDSFNLKELKFDPQKGLENLADLRRMNISLRELSASFHVPKEWILLERTIILLLGLCTELDPDLNPMGVIRPYLERFVLGPDQDWSKFVVDTTKDVAMAALALPGEMRRFITRAQRGELEVRFGNVDEAAQRVVAVGHQLIYTAVGIAACALAVTFEGRGQAEPAETAWTVATVAGVLLVLSMWSGRRRRR
jgi:predicted unusual protein kinase regulating ubiquinone biosynthesis (AarF/ABC1/UbiB family)